MARAKRIGDVRRLLLRHLYTEEMWKLFQLRDLLWDVLITREFAAGNSVAEVAQSQSNRSDVRAVEAALRREMRRRSVR